jgi:3-phosphoshikimate 1-carboxyvinyltransferase
VTITPPTGTLIGTVQVPSSKSESNRLLIIQALSRGAVQVTNLSAARDTLVMQHALQTRDIQVDIGDAGTAMRFLTAYYALMGEHRILTGSPRMCERPIGILVEALQRLGFEIQYLGKIGYPPLEIKPSTQPITCEVSIAGDVSSQYISALLMIAPLLPSGLRLTCTTSWSSRPYIDMTLALMRSAGIVSVCTDTEIYIAPQAYIPTHIRCGGDWSAASYWYALAALSPAAHIRIGGLGDTSLQGDSLLIDWMARLGVNTSFDTEGALLTTHSSSVVMSELDFTDYPDLAQTLIVLYAARGWRARCSGLESLRIKETDRILALQNELLKCGIKLYESSTGVWELAGDYQQPVEAIATYGDHRMAMSFATLAALGRVTIADADVVSKSYPTFWQEMQRLGFKIP